MSIQLPASRGKLQRKLFKPSEILLPYPYLINMIKKLLYLTTFSLILSCGGSDEPTKKTTTTGPPTIVVDPSVTYQEMIGFGGALTWYSERITASSKKNEIATVLFKDLGIDIIRLKNWYYPDNYPVNKETTTMSDDNSKTLWDASNQLQQLAKSNNPNVKILLSSWGPPAGLKSNASTRQGTLKANGTGAFMYDEFATYFVDILDHLPFTPEYISIQNEPSFINPGWTTSEWAATETGSLPGYDKAFDKVYDKIKTRTNPPVMIGPESANIAGNVFTSFADALKNKPGLGVYAYHPYNFGSGTDVAQTASLLQTIRSYSDKPNIMTEYSDNLSWFNTARFINNTVIFANSSGYIYWKLMWAQPAAGSADAGMISMGTDGNYTITPYYHVIKHFAKQIDAGFKRVSITSTHSSLSISAFTDPSQHQLTLVVINFGGQTKVNFEATGKTISTISAVQSIEGSFYKDVPVTAPGDAFTLPGQSITTVVLGI
jgi:glucuronoarabinoxylan endo-1,4-beta-xylanase